MPMPEASMDQDGFVVSGQYDVGRTRQGLHMQAKPIPQAMQYFSDGQFGSGVLAPHTAHDFTAFLGGNLVHLPSDEVMSKAKNNGMLGG